jgi:hypothetical protein
MVKRWWHSRTIWAGVFAIVTGAATLARVFPQDVENALAMASMFNGALVIYFRRTTNTGIIGAISDNRITGLRT